jgi:hypothetical protein
MRRHSVTPHKIQDNASELQTTFSTNERLKPLSCEREGKELEHSPSIDKRAKNTP